jgi:hypothetical protein
VMNLKDEDLVSAVALVVDTGEEDVAAVDADPIAEAPDGAETPQVAEPEA